MVIHELHSYALFILEYQFALQRIVKVVKLKESKCD